jgi:hypothetical protein
MDIGRHVVAKLLVLGTKTDYELPIFSAYVTFSELLFPRERGGSRSSGFPSIA